MGNEKVSIVIPLFNRARLIKDTLQSLYQQTYADWEVVIVDDGSTDDSYAVVLEEARSDERIKLFKREQTPKGAPTCRNIGIENATGTFIIFLDSDDLLAPYCLEERVEAFSKNQDYDFLVFQGAFFEHKMGDTNIRWNRFTNEIDLNRFLRGDVVWQTSAPIWKKTSLVSKKIYFYEYALSGQDWEFHLNALVKELKYKKINNLPDYFVRRSIKNKADSISSTHGKVISFSNRLDLYTYILKTLGLNKAQKRAIFKLIKNDLFNVYTKINDHNELNSILNKVKPLALSTSFFIFKLSYQLKYVLAKLTFGKSHHVFYYFKKLKSKPAGYRSSMSKMDYDKLQNRLIKSNQLS